MNESPPPPSGPLKAYAAAAKWSLWLLVIFWLALVLAWGALHGWIVPRIGDWRPELETQASRALGVPVRIGSITARSEGLVPSFELRDVVIADAQGRDALRLSRVLAALSPRSLWNFGFDQLYVEQPQLDIRRSADGRLFIAGIDLSTGGGAEDSRAADWFFRQTEVVVRGGTVRWTDEQRGAPELALQAVDVVVRNSLRGHSLRVDATPPSAWGERFSVRGVFRQPLLSVHAGRWREWEGQLHGDFAQVDLSQLRRYADLGVEVESGRGVVRAWADVARGEATGGMADLVLSGVGARLGKGLEPLMLQSLSGRFSAKRLTGGFEFETRELQFQPMTGARWPGGNVYLNWVKAQNQQPERGELRADKLDLAALSQIAGHLPLGTATHNLLATHAPRGLVETLQARWQGPADALQKYEARGRASRLELAGRSRPELRPGRPAAGVPGLRGASVDFDMTEAGGNLRLQIAQGAVELPGVLEEPVVPLDQLTASAQWKHNGEQLSVNLTGLKFGNADMQGEGQATWRTSENARGRFPGVLDLQATLSRADGTRVWRYLPTGVPKTARDYVRDAILQGEARDARFRLKGDLFDFPFTDPKSGEFRVVTQVQNATYAYVPPRLVVGPGQWPALTQLSGELAFERTAMRVSAATGRFVGAPGLQVKADVRIPDLRTTTVAVTGSVRGPLAESLRIVNGSPISQATAPALARATATGDADVQLQLALPIAGLDRSRVLGTVTLAGNDIRVTPDTPLLAAARGAVVFSERGFVLAGARARALGGDVQVEGGSRNPLADPAGSGSAAAPDAGVLIRAQGVATAEGLRQTAELGGLVRFAKYASGATPYSAALSFRRGVPEILVSSTLQGLALTLPPPLAKAADSQLALQFENALLPESLAAPLNDATQLRDRLTLTLGRVVAADFVRDVSGAEPRVLRGGVAVGLAPNESAPTPLQGVAANVNLGTINVDAWEDVLAAAAPATTMAPRTLAAGTGASANTSANIATAGYLPTVMAVRAQKITVDGRTLHNVVLGGSRDGLNWRANVDADELNGYVEYRQPAGAGAGRVYARLARLQVAAAAASDVETLLDQQPGNIPALDIVVDDFELRGKRLGRLEIDAVNRGAGAVARDGGMREWRLNKLNLTMPEAVFAATGNWAALDAQAPAAGAAKPPPRPVAERRRTVMNFRLDIADSGLLLSRFGMKDVVRRGRGKLEGQVAWLGSPLSLDYPSLTGAFNVGVEAGQFLKADPGLAKLLGVLSLQSLPRRLSLDFRDVFSEGFAFDFVRGDVTIQQGIAATNNLQMKGVNAAVLMEGKADIARETQDIKVVVVPEINAGTASLVATVINPAIGLGTFLAQIFLREPLMRAATQEFHLDGTWTDPKITKTDRSTSRSGSN